VHCRRFSGPPTTTAKFDCENCASPFFLHLQLQLQKLTSKFLASEEASCIGYFWWFRGFYPLDIPNSIFWISAEAFIGC
jgi:hypothetical protein